ncbi:MAG: 16S rRNA (uracil(1498)-N(3))-methyltransferase [Bacteroidetes bacterium]|nr:16S rRNA (uracil(1498)-N(3))-methyltransferase [Bacteroidota bacterium]
MDEVFYQLVPAKTGYNFPLSEESHHHAIRVLRHQVGDTLWFTNGQGQFIEARLSSVSKKESVAEIVTVENQTFPLLAKLHIAAGLLKINSRMDWIIEKGSELGLSSFIPLETERTIKQSGKTDRWDKLAISALKQSKNAWKLQVAEPESFKKVILKLPASSLFLICHEIRKPESLTISSLDVSGFSDIFLFLGPEGGFSDAEIELASKSNAKIVWLGSQRLRTESAAIVALSALHQKLIVT